MFDYLIVGAGFFGATFARLATDSGHKCLVIDSRSNVAGNAYSENIEGIEVHKYGPHIFHTDSEKIWKFINRFSEFNNFILSPKAIYKDKIYSLPFNMNTYYEMWGCITPNDAKNIIDSQKYIGNVDNLEKRAISLVGKDIYEKLIYGYTKKQWRRDPKDLPESIIKRLPVRFTYDNNYFNDRYQGIPINGYTKLISNILEGIEVRLNQNYLMNREHFNSLANKIVFTGKIDEFYDYEFGELEYLSLNFEHNLLEQDNYQGCAVINYTDEKIPYTRIIEHKHFNKIDCNHTIITKEYPIKWDKNAESYYPINDLGNTARYKKYYEKSKLDNKIIFGGRLAEYKYYDMHMVIGSAMSKFNNLTSNI